MWRPMSGVMAGRVRLRIREGEQRFGIGPPIARGDRMVVSSTTVSRASDRRKATMRAAGWNQSTAHQHSSAMVCSQSRRLTWTSSCAITARCTARRQIEHASRQQDDRAAHANRGRRADLVGDGERGARRRATRTVRPAIASSDGAGAACAMMARRRMKPRPSHSSRATMPGERSRAGATG